jgi:hypothetical protein
MNKATNAKDYIERHGLEPVLTEMLNSLVYEKVRNPEIYMIKYLAGQLSKEDRIKYGIHVPDALPEPKKIVSYPTHFKNETVRKHLNKKIWEKLKYKTTKHGGTLSDMLQNENSGIILTDADVLIYVIVGS